MISSSDICLFLFPQANVLKVDDVESVKKYFFLLYAYLLIYFLKNSGAGSRCCASSRCSAVLSSVGSLLTKQNISEWRYMALMACCGLFCRWEWILLGQREAPVSHHDGIPAQPWSPHAVGAVEPWERAPAQPSAAEPPAHQQYVLGEKECLQPCWELGLPSFPASARGKWWETRGDSRVSPSPACCTWVSCPRHSLQVQVTAPLWKSHSLMGLGLPVFNWYFHGLDWKEK